MFRAALTLALASLTGCAATTPPITSIAHGKSTSLFEELQASFVTLGFGAARFHPGAREGDVTLEGGPGALAVALAERSYRVRVDVQVEEGGNSGVFVRARPGLLFPEGVEVQIDADDPSQPTGSIYGRVRSTAAVPPAGAWFTLDVVVTEGRVQSYVDGEEAAAVEDHSDGPLLALQMHHPGSTVHFRDLVIDPR